MSTHNCACSLVGIRLHSVMLLRVSWIKVVTVQAFALSCQYHHLIVSSVPGMIVELAGYGEEPLT